MSGGTSLFVKLTPGEDGRWVAGVPALPGCISQGDTKADALTNVREAALLCLEDLVERGLPIPDESSSELDRIAV